MSYKYQVKWFGLTVWTLDFGLRKQKYGFIAAI